MAPSEVVFCLSHVLVLLTVNDLTLAGVFLCNTRGACCTLLPYIDFFARACVSILETCLVLCLLCVRTFWRFRDYILSYLFHVHVVVSLLGDLACLNLVYMACFVLGRHLFVSIAIIYESV